MKLIPILVLYLGVALLHAGGMIATQNEQCHNRLSNICDQYMVRSDYGMAFIYGFGLITWPTVWFATGLWSDGVSFHETPDHIRSAR